NDRSFFWLSHCRHLNLRLAWHERESALVRVPDIFRPRSLIFHPRLQLAWDVSRPGVQREPPPGKSAASARNQNILVFYLATGLGWIGRRRPRACFPVFYRAVGLGPDLFGLVAASSTKAGAQHRDSGEELLNPDYSWPHEFQRRLRAHQARSASEVSSLCGLACASG
ncbi:MAG: hypothetical protein B7Z73_05560, partial [Planctomycetia bacterium 21-64-5]